MAISAKIASFTRPARTWSPDSAAENDTSDVIVISFKNIVMARLPGVVPA